MGQTVFSYLTSGINHFKTAEIVLMKREKKETRRPGVFSGVTGLFDLVEVARIELASENLYVRASTCLGGF